jgi:hypothetical protein
MRAVERRLPWPPDGNKIVLLIALLGAMNSWGTKPPLEESEIWIPNDR